MAEPVALAPPAVDLAAPLLPQVAALGERYDAWVHRSIGPNTAERVMTPHVAAGDRFATRWPHSLRIFRTPWLEAQSHIRWQLIPSIWLPIVAALLIVAAIPLGLGWLAAPLYALLGVFAWTLIEYVLHRFIFHWRPKSAWGRQVHFLVHGIHHLDPWDPTRLVFPPLAGLAIAGLIYLGFWSVLPTPVATAVMAGVLVGYIVYDLSHYYTHHARPRARYGKFLKAWHLAHHHKFWTRMYGVSSPLWDLVFRTGKP
ncbi:MAG: sterol desaturase family protein [Planctomycetota bacterium]|nr:sterol desaturase family protein [Planctomycetota bacterium]